MENRPQSSPDPPLDDRLPLTPLTMAILLSLAAGDCHGYALMQKVEKVSGGNLSPGTGSLYAALERLMNDGLIEEAPDDGEPTPGRPRKVHRITDAGRAAARAEAGRMVDVVRIAKERSLIPDELSGLGWVGGEA